MKIVIALVIVLLLHCLFIVDSIASNVSCYGISTCINMTYSREQLISLRKNIANDSNSYVSILKEHGLFKYQGPRGCRSGRQVKNKLYNIPTIKANLDKFPVLTPSRSRSSVAQNPAVSKDNLVSVHIEKSLPDVRNKGVNLSLVNTRSICGPPGKTQDFLDYTFSSHLDVCIVTETFLVEHNNVTRASLHPPGYSFVDQPRLNGQARGGIGIFHKNSFKVQKIDSGEKRSFEFSEWIISWQNVRLKVCVVYHIPYSRSHPVTDATFLEEIQEYLESIALCNEKLLIAGDFNLHVDDESDQYGNEFCDFLDSVGLVNHVNVPTHESGHTLDLLITRNNGEISLTTPRAGYFISDHCFVQ